VRARALHVHRDMSEPEDPSKAQDELKAKIEAKKQELNAKIDELKDDESKEGQAKKKAAKDRIMELEKELEQGWSNMSDAVKSRLNKWLKR
jgi:uncharacterized protein YicC (UPF0701 family)